MAIQKVTNRTRWTLLALFVVGLGTFAILLTALDELNDDHPAHVSATTHRTITIAAPTPATSVAPTSRTPIVSEVFFAPGTFSIGDVISGGPLSSIPPGRYRAIPVGAGGYVTRCAALPCTPNHPHHVVSTEQVVSETVLDLEPSDAAVLTFEVRLVPTR
ncbi:hypothetical protein [Nocardia sp. NPDC051833]|uniref:hypothetical protein n=1 Tax=Nocardia sp. NPDC051833 TaxID=3155674 RepID=UPI003425AB11